MRGRISIALVVLGVATLGFPAIASASHGQTQCFESSRPFAYVTVPFGQVSVTIPVGQQGLRCYRTYHAPRYHYYSTTPYPYYGYPYPVQQPVFIPHPYPYQPHPYYQSRHPLVQPGYPVHHPVTPYQGCRYQQVWDPYRFQMVWVCR